MQFIVMRVLIFFYWNAETKRNEINQMYLIKKKKFTN